MVKEVIPHLEMNLTSIVETAGFVPLEVRFKRMEQSGYVAQFYTSQFDSDDYRQIFMGDETEIYADDDEDTVMIKLAKQQKIRDEIIKAKLGDLAEVNDDGGRQDDGGSNGSKSSSQNVQSDGSHDTNE